MSEENKKQLESLQEFKNQMEENLKEIYMIEDSLAEIEKLEGDEEFLAPISNGIFIEGKLKTDKTLKVNVGDGVVVRKTIPETMNLLEKQKDEIQKSLKNTEKEIEKVKGNV